MIARWSYTETKRHVENIYKMRWHRMRRLSVQAGLDPDLLGIHPHNAMCGYHDGKPWRGVDYSLVRKIMWLDRKNSDLYRLLDRYCNKRTDEDRFWIEPNQGKFA